MPRKRGKRLKGQPKCKACGCEEILLVENKHVGCFVVRCHDNPWHHSGDVFRSAEEAIAAWRRLNLPETAA